MTGGERTSYTLDDFAARFGGEVIGDRRVRITQVATLEGATPHSIAFLANERYLHQLKGTHAGAVILGAALRAETMLPRIVTDNPYAYFARVSALLNPQRAAAPGVHASAVVDATASVSAAAEIGAHAVIASHVAIDAGTIVGPGCVIGEGATLGRDVRLYPGVTVYHDCHIGDRTIVHSGVVIGADGFGIASAGTQWIKVPQIGRVLIGADVEIGANTTIDRGAIDDTVIEDGVKLDNQIQVAHNVRIGAHTAIAACAGIAGSARIGRNCRIGGASGITGHISIADNVEISAHTLITKSIERPGTYSGAYPFSTNAQWRKSAVHLRRLDELAERVRTLERMLAAKERSRL